MTMTIVEQSEGPDGRAERAERLQHVRRAIYALPSEQQEVFLLRQNGGMKYGDIAGLLGVPEGTVKTRMRAALKRLREAVETDF